MKITEVSGKLLYGLESFWIFWKVSGLSAMFFVFSGKFPDCLEHLRIVRKVSVLSVKFAYCL